MDTDTEKGQPTQRWRQRDYQELLKRWADHRAQAQARANEQSEQLIPHYIDGRLIGYGMPGQPVCPNCQVITNAWHPKSGWSCTRCGWPAVADKGIVVDLPDGKTVVRHEAGRTPGVNCGCDVCARRRACMCDYCLGREQSEPERCQACDWECEPGQCRILGNAVADKGHRHEPFAK